MRVIFDLFAARCQVCNGEREREKKKKKKKKKKNMSKGNPRGRVRRRRGAKERSVSWQDAGRGMCGTVSVYIERRVYVLTVSSVYLWRNSLFLFLLAPHAASSHNALPPPEYPDCCVNPQLGIETRRLRFNGETGERVTTFHSSIMFPHPAAWRSTIFFFFKDNLQHLAEVLSAGPQGTRSELC